MSENTLLKLPREVRDMIYTNVVHGLKFNFINPEASVPDCVGMFAHCKPEHRHPQYAGLLLASKDTSAEIQEVLYKEGVFWAYLSECEVYRLPPPSRDIFARFQKVNLYLDVGNPSRVPTISGSPRYMRPALEGIPTFSFSPAHYRQWLNLFGGSRNIRKLCRITILNISPTTDNLNQTRDFQQFLEVCKTFVGFEIVILELGREGSGIATGPIRDAEYAGEGFEALKKRLHTELEPFLGHCIYYDRDVSCCLEFRPRTDAPIEPGCEPYTVELDD